MSFTGQSGNRASSALSVRTLGGGNVLADESGHLVLQAVELGVAREPSDHGLFPTDGIGICPDHLPLSIANLVVRPPSTAIAVPGTTGPEEVVMTVLIFSRETIMGVVGLHG